MSGMARGKTGVWLVGAGLLASWAVSSASDGPPALPAAPAPEAPQSAAARAMAAEIGRLQSREVMPARGGETLEDATYRGALVSM